MIKLIVNLPENIKSQAEAQATAAGYQSVDQYICSLIQDDEFQPIDAALEGELLRGLDGGPSIFLTPKLIDEIKRNARQA